MSEAPERIWMDPDIKFPECDKQYGSDVEYVRADRIEELTNCVAVLEAKLSESEALLAKATYKSAALVYSDMTEGDRVACDFTLCVTGPAAMRLDFVSTFCLEVKRTQAPVGVVFYLGTTIVGYGSLQALGLRQTVRQWDTITIQPPSEKSKERSDDE